MSQTSGKSGPEYLKKKIQIGGRSSGLLNYTASQNVFHHDDISAEKRARKAEVCAFAKQDQLIQRQPSWNKSTDPENPLVERRTMENFVKDRCKKVLLECISAELTDFFNCSSSVSVQLQGRGIAPCESSADR